MNSSKNADIPDAEVRQKIQILINNVGIKSNPFQARENLLGGSDFMLDCRGLPDAVTGIPKQYAGLEDYVEKQIDLGMYVHVILQAIHAAPKRRWNLGSKWADKPFRITCFCAHGMHRSRAMRNLLKRELLALGYNVKVTVYTPQGEYYE